MCVFTRMQMARVSIQIYAIEPVRCVYVAASSTIYYVFAAGPAPFGRNTLCRGN